MITTSQVFQGKLPAIRIARSEQNDLATINGIVERAVLRWPMSIRVKRRAIPLLQYDAIDMASYVFFRCELGDIIVAAIALDFEYLGAHHSRNDLLLHGIYVDPVAQGRGVGRALLEFAEHQAREHNFAGVALKAERVSRGFFENRGYSHNAPRTSDDYPYFYQKSVTALPINMPESPLYAR